jgi:hypothetical protein
LIYVTKSDLTGYADDLSGTVTNKNRNEVVADVQEAINQVNYVCNEKRLLLNPEKTMYLEFHSSHKNIDNSTLFRVNDKSVQRVDFAKLLGLFIDHQLNWNMHVNYVSGKLSSSIFVLYSLREKISEDILLLSFFSYV